MLIGRTYLSPPFYNAAGYVIKTDKNGNMVWEKEYDRGPYDDLFVNILPSVDGNFFLAGIRFNYTDYPVTGSFPKAWLLKIDASGNVLWERLIEIRYDELEHLYVNDMTLNPYGGVALTGYSIYNPSPTKNDIIFITTDSCGFTEGDTANAAITTDSISSHACHFSNTGSQYCSSWWSFGDGNMANTHHATHTYSDTGYYSVMLVARAGNDLDTAYLQVHIADTSTAIGQQTTVVKAQMRLYPNPASKEVVIEWASAFQPETILLYDCKGAAISRIKIKTGSSINLPVSAYPAGVYFIRAMDNAGEYQFLKFLITR